MSTLLAAPTIDPRRLFTKAEYARKIRKSQTWVAHLIRKGELQEIEINGRKLILEKEA